MRFECIFTELCPHLLLIPRNILTWSSFFKLSLDQFNALPCFRLIKRQWSCDLPCLKGESESRVRFLETFLMVDKFRKCTGNQGAPFVFLHMVDRFEHLPPCCFLYATLNLPIELISIIDNHYFHCRTASGH